ncbi:Glycosyl transferase family 2 [Arthrobacter sp. ok909]|uniref:glycosyltransferase family 2 protein n=1 Tax=Arthrobacter sp. ok909 TaxID=1761746 RepID=UPI00088BBF17|nr:glycosyltransferase family 2 protein [Arthrobacter sp. ok909]SDP53035.1 Glycosyl transferase family 2 [Arthrobacter sp. ok909]
MQHTILTMSRGDAPRLREWVEYHSWLGFDDFHVILDNPTDDSANVLRTLHVPAKITVEVRPAFGEYYDGLAGDEKVARAEVWREMNRERIVEWGLPIVDPLSMRQYLYLPAALNKYALRGEGWVSVIDVDEFIVLPGGRKISDVTTAAKMPRVRFLNFNFDFKERDPGRPILQQHTRRWAREDIVGHGQGWDTRVKSIARYDAAVPMASVHAISRGWFETLEPEIGRLHHYKVSGHGVPVLPFCVEDRAAADAFKVSEDPPSRL